MTDFLGPHLNRCVQLTAEQEKTATLDELVKSQMRMAMACANSFSRRFNADRDDLISEAMLGLVIAARRYEPSHTNRFSTYAVLWVRAMLRHYTMRNRRCVRHPTDRESRKAMPKVAEAQRRLGNALGREPTDGEVAEHIGVSVETIEQVNAWYRRADVPKDMKDWGHAGDDDPTAAYDEQQLAEEIQLIMGKLDTRSRYILTSYYFDDSSLQDIANDHNLSRERVRQIKFKALDVVRAGVEKRQLQSA